MWVFLTHFLKFGSDIITVYSEINAKYRKPVFLIQKVVPVA